jgi:hypothetical protein
VGTEREGRGQNYIPRAPSPAPRGEGLTHIDEGNMLYRFCLDRTHQERIDVIPVYPNLLRLTPSLWDHRGKHKL